MAEKASKESKDTKETKTEEKDKAADDKKETIMSTTPSVPPRPVLKVAPVHTPEEIYRFIDLGLGRGLDGTDPTPWLNKGSFQVRNVTFENILGTEEGGALRSYEREISSVHTQQTKIKSSLLVPESPLTIGADAELSRSVSTTRRAVGRKVINRTISFRDNFYDLPVNNTIFGIDPSVQNQFTFEERQNQFTFEERLAQWILDHLQHDESHPKLESHISLEAISGSEKPLEELAHILKHGSRADFKLIAKYCDAFVNNFRITHYVNAIELGAAEYRILTEEEYQTALGVAGSFGIDKLASVVTRQDFSIKKKKHASDLKQIGRIGENGTVDRGSYGEAVVGVKIKPITTLVKMKFLNVALEKALLKFVDSQSDNSDGPFFIACGSGGDGPFLRVDPRNHDAVVATRDIGIASPFYVLPTDNPDIPNEFYIAHYEDISDTRKVTRRKSEISVFSEHRLKISSVPKYLEAPLNWLGRNRGPLLMRDTVNEESSRFVLHHRVIRNDKPRPNPLNSWINGGDMFYINCSRRRHRKDGYLCIRRAHLRQPEQQGDDNFITACVRDIDYHDNVNVFMLFRLLPGYYLSHEDDEISDDERLMGYEPVDKPAKADPIKHELDSDQEDQHKVTSKLLGDVTDPDKKVTITTPGFELHTTSQV